MHESAPWRDPRTAGLWPVEPGGPRTEHRQTVVTGSMSGGVSRHRERTTWGVPQRPTRMHSTGYSRRPRTRLDRLVKRGERVTKIPRRVHLRSRMRICARASRTRRRRTTTFPELSPGRSRRSSTRLEARSRVGGEGALRQIRRSCLRLSTQSEERHVVGCPARQRVGADSGCPRPFPSQLRPISGGGS